MGVNPKIGVFSPPQIHGILIGFSMIFTIHFGGGFEPTPIFGKQHPYLLGLPPTQ